MSFADEIAVRTLWGEARGEPPEGQFAVAHVLRNRVKDGRWGHTAGLVCLAPMQFSCWNASDPNRAKMLGLDDADSVLASCRAAWLQSASDSDPTQGACFYYADSLKYDPSWAATMTETIHIGHHHFLKDR